MSKPLSTRQKAVLDLTIAGHSRYAISLIVKMPMNQVSRDRRTLKDLGYLKDSPKDPIKLHNIPTGSLSKVIGKTSHDVKSWIVQNIPKDVTVAEFAMSCLLDQYHEETDSE